MLSRKIFDRNYYNLPDSVKDVDLLCVFKRRLKRYLFDATLNNRLFQPRRLSLPAANYSAYKKMKL